jgi:hypothetical protein
MPCLNVRISTASIGLRARVTQFCGIGLNAIPLFVDEGYLFVDFNGGYTQLLVDKK